MKISDISIKRPKGLIAILIALLLLGGIGLTFLNVDLFPSMTIPRISITTIYPGAGPKEVEELVTKVIENKVSTISGMKEMVSYSYDDLSQVSLELEDGVDMESVADLVREKLDDVERELPDDVESPRVRKADPNAMPIMRLAVTDNATGNMEELTGQINDLVVEPLQRIEGVASVDVSGDLDKEVRVVLDKDMLQAYGLDQNRVMQQINAQNRKMPVGEYTRGDSELTLSVDGEFKNEQDIRDMPITTGVGIIRLKDIADVKILEKDRDMFTTLDGKPCITVNIKKQSDANTVKVVGSVKEEIDRILEENPDMSMVISKDDSKTINNSIMSVISAGIVGGALAIIILFIFLMSLRSTFIIATAIPISIVITFALMYFLGVGINMISLMGLALGIGMLVDNGIVVLENIYRYRQLGYDMMEAAKKGVSEVGLAIIASTLTSIAVFLPIIFIDGFAAQIFKDMSLTVTSSLVASLFVALTLVPMLCSRLLNKVELSQKTPKVVLKIVHSWESLFERIESMYSRFLRKSLKHRYKVMIASIVMLVGVMSIIPSIGMEFMPEIDEGIFRIDITLPSGRVVEETEEVVKAIENNLLEVEEINSSYIYINGNEASITCDIGERSDRRRGINEVVDDIRIRLTTIAGAELSVSSVSLSSMASGGGGKPVSIEIYGDNFSELEEISKDFKDIVEGIEGTREVTSSISDGGYEGIIEINKDLAAEYGLTVGSIAGELRSAVNGSVQTSLKQDNDSLDINVIYDDSDLDSMEGVKNLPVTTSFGEKISLDEVAGLKRVPSPKEIKRINKTRVVTVDAAISGRDINSIKKDINITLEEYNMPEKYSYKFGSGISSMMDSFTSLLGALLISIVLIYLIMVAQFESFSYPFIIMFSVPYALIGGILALFTTGTSLSIVGLVGFIMLVGIVVNNAIVLMEYTNKLRSEGVDLKEALLKAGPLRLKPILMTTLTTVLGMLPLAIGMGQGAEIQAPLARVIVGGLTLSTVVTLIIIPVNYMILEDIYNKKKKRANKNPVLKI